MKRLTLLVIAALLGTSAAALAADPCACGAPKCSAVQKTVSGNGLFPAEMRP